MFKKIQGNVWEDSRECPEDSVESSERFNGMSEKVKRKVQGIFDKIPENGRKESREWLKKIPENFIKDFEEWNVQEDSGDLNMDLFCEILLILITFCY